MKKLTGISLIAAGLLLATSAFAVPVNGLIANNGQNASLVHPGSNPGGAGGPEDWYWFEGDSPFTFDYTNGVVTTSGIQSYTLTRADSNQIQFDIVSLFLDTNGPNGFSTGQMEYRIDGGNVGVFTFEAIRANGAGSSSMLDGVDFSAFLWGGDITNELGIDFSFSGMLATTVSEPPVLVLFGLGGLLLMARRRR